MKIVTKRVLGSSRCLVKEPAQYGVFHADQMIDTPYQAVGTPYQAGRYIWQLREVFHNVAYYDFKFVLFKDDERYYLGPETFC